MVIDWFGSGKHKIIEREAEIELGETKSCTQKGIAVDVTATRKFVRCRGILSVSGDNETGGDANYTANG